MTTAKEICEGVTKTLLDSPVDDVHLAELAHDMEEWEELAPFLGLTPAEESAIVEKYRGRLRLQIREALRMWKKKKGSKASYRALIIVFCVRKRVDLAEKVKALSLTAVEKPPETADNELHITNKAQPGLHSSSPAITSIFRNYLNDCYDIPQPPSWPNLDNKGYVALELQEAPVKPNAANELKNWKPIALESLFSAGNSQPKRKVILVEGVAGVGKTTLSWHAMKKWAKGEIFQDIELLVHVSLGDPDVQRATKLADLVPHQSDKMRSKVADAIASDGGKNVCFWLDGLDEAPLPFLQSFLYQFLAGTGGRTKLSDVSIVVTSRPGFAAKLNTILTGRVVIQGLCSLDSYIAMYLPKETEQFLEALKMKPEIYTLCNIPINAAIIVYLYDELKDNLPTTRTGLFDPLVRHTVLRHMLTRTSHEHPNVHDFPANLPEDIRSLLSKVSDLAFRLALNRKKFVSRATLMQRGIENNTFGLLRARLQFTMYGPNEHFSFAHLSLQEFLAAFHISQMDQQQQVKAIKVVFDQNPSSPILTFYAGLSKLVVSEAREIYFKVLSKPYDEVGIINALGLQGQESKINPNHDPRRHLLCLMNGLYETQSPHLFSLVRLRVTSYGDMLVNEVFASENRDAPKRAFIIFSFMYLYPSDCISLGYFIRHTCSTVKRMYVDLSNTLLMGREIKALTQELSKPTSSHNVYLNINRVIFSINSLHSLKAIFNSKSCLYGIECASKYQFEDTKLAMKYITEGYAKSNCRHLTLGTCSSDIIHYLLLLLRCRCLDILSLPQSSDLFTSPGAMLLFSEALKYSQLSRLSLENCGIDDNSLKLLAIAIFHEENILQILEIDNNSYTDHGLTYLLELMIRRLPVACLRVLSADRISDKHKKLVDMINNLRQRYIEFPNLIVGCKSKLQEQSEESQEKYEGYNSLMRFDLAIRFPHH